MQSAWSTDKFKYRAVHINHLVKRLNRFATWVAAMVVWPTSRKQRVEVMERILVMAQAFRRYNNFQGLMGVFAGLEMAAVTRLKHTFAGVKGKCKPQLKELKELFDPRNSWKTYRHVIGATDTVAVPYM